jgi:hypothetical protein
MRVNAHGGALFGQVTLRNAPRFGRQVSRLERRCRCSKLFGCVVLGQPAASAILSVSTKCGGHGSAAAVPGFTFARPHVR